MRIIGDEGEVPYCERCKKPLFDMFSTCIIALVVNEKGEAALLRQGYLSHTWCTLVSGYMKPGEKAEEAARREIEEETGLQAEKLTFTGTYWFDKKDMLMIGFIAKCRKKDFVLSREVDGAFWVPAEQAVDLVHPGKSISRLLLDAYLEQKRKN